MKNFNDAMIYNDVVVELPEEAEVHLEKLGSSIKILVLDETFEDWQVWRPFVRVLGRRKDLALRVYSKILEMNRKKISARRLATSLSESMYSVNKVCDDLEKLGLIDSERRFRGAIAFNYWRPKKKVLGILRLIPSKYFEKRKWRKLAKKWSEE